MDLFIIDGIGPFFRGFDEKVINWSKAPFAHLERCNGLDHGLCDRIQSDFGKFCAKASSVGYNAVTLDDLAHCCIFPFYSDGLKLKIEEYRRLYRSLFATARDFGMKVLITTDLLFFNEEIESHVAPKDVSLRRFASHAYRHFDRVVSLNILSLIYPLLKRLDKKVVPDFASETAMGFDSIFK